MHQALMSRMPTGETTARRAAEIELEHEDQEQLLDQLFNDELLEECYAGLLSKNDGEVKRSMQRLLAGLHERQSKSALGDWKDFVKYCRLHPIFDLVHNDPFTRRAFHKPRGYPGDAETLDLIYGVEENRGPPPETSELGRLVFECTTATPPCRGVRNRARIVAETVDQVAQDVRRPEVLSVAAGHLREADLSGALKQRRVGRWVAFDADIESLAEVHRCYGHYNVETFAGTVRQFIRGQTQLGEFHFIYSTGLFDYLQEPLGKRLTTRMFDMLRPGGRLLIANFLEGIDGRGFMECFMDWHLVYRDHREMLDLALAIDRARVGEVRLFTDLHRCHDLGDITALDNIVFVELTKRR